MSDQLFLCEALKTVGKWGVWKLETVNGRQTKIPYDIVTGKRASTTDPACWRSYSLVSDLLKTDCNRYSGLGLLISDGLVFVDIDHCIDEDGNISDTGQDVLSAFPESYAEISQSGKGIHILTRGEIPKSFNNRREGVEMYATKHYCAYTGNAIQRASPSEEQPGIDYVFHKYGPKIVRKNQINPDLYPETHTDTWVIRHAAQISGQQGKNFQTLFAGDHSKYESRSEADCALCVLLAFWCDRNPDQIDRIFRQSGLYRPVWEKKHYRDVTISAACQYIPESLSEYIRRMNREKAKALAEEFNHQA